MKAAVSDAIGAKPAFSCKGQLINEIWVCLTKDLKVHYHPLHVMYTAVGICPRLSVLLRSGLPCFCKLIFSPLLVPFIEFVNCLQIRDCGMPAKSCGTYTQIPPFVTKLESYEEDLVDML